MDHEKLKEARTALIEKVANLAKQPMAPDDLVALDNLLRSVERIDELLRNR